MAQNLTYAHEYYKKVIKYGSSEKPLTAHSNFNLGLLSYFGEIPQKNLTQFEKYLSTALKNDKNLTIPVEAIRSYVWLVESSLASINESVIELLHTHFSNFVFNGILLIAALYSLFFVSISLQRDK